MADYSWIAQNGQGTQGVANNLLNAVSTASQIKAQRQNHLLRDREACAFRWRC